MPALLAALEKDLAVRAAARPGGVPPELAFYGGTFTALPIAEQLACLELAVRLKGRGLISRLRCSTRPDAVSAAHLSRLKGLGLDCVELGVQSFCEGPLSASRRGYSPAQALEGCAVVRESGMELGVQLMPGMPGMKPEDFVKDIRLVRALAPATLRLYPCLVLEGTALAALWRAGEFTPWPLGLCLELMAEALLEVWAAGTRVIRMGLAPEAALASRVLAGPQHPAFGQMARSLALFRFLRAKLAELGRKPEALHAPRRLQGEFFGHKNSLVEDYARMGLDKSRIFWWDNSYFLLN